MYKVIVSFLCLFLVIIGLAFIFSTYDANSLEETKTITNPTVDEVLADHPDADIFVYDDIVYIQAEDIEWVNELDLHPKLEEEFVIMHQAKEVKNITNKTATTLPVGTHIYEPTEQYGLIYIAIVNGKELRYLGLIEG